MKTFSCVIIQLLLLLLICGVAIAEDNFPVQVKQYFENEKILEIETYSSSEKLFAAIARDQNHERVLYAFQYINGKWECFTKTKNAIPKMELKAFVSFLIHIKIVISKASKTFPTYQFGLWSQTKITMNY